MVLYRHSGRQRALRNTGGASHPVAIARASLSVDGHPVLASDFGSTEEEPHTAMKFVVPDKDRVRISECGRYLIVKRVDRDGKPITYELWKYEFVATGFLSAEQAIREIEVTEAEAKAINDSLISSASSKP